MSFTQAVRVAWSLFWRQALWTVGLAVVAVALGHELAVQLAVSRGWAMAAGATLFLAGYVLGALPFSTRALMEIEFTGFRIVVARRGEGRENLSYGEAVLFGLVAEVLTDLSAGLALGLCVGAIELVNAMLPGSWQITLVPALLVAATLKPAILLWLPAPGFRLEILDDFECAQEHAIRTV